MSVWLYLQQCVAYQVKCDQELEDMGDKLALAVGLYRYGSHLSYEAPRFCTS